MRTENRNSLVSLSEIETLLNISPFPVISFNTATFQIDQVNRPAIIKYGYSEPEFCSMSIDGIFSQTDNIKYIDWIQINPPNRGSIWNHVKKNGQTFYAKVQGEKYLDNNQEHILIMIHDITSDLHQKAEIRGYKRIFDAITDINQVLSTNISEIDALNQSFEVLGKTLQIDRIYYFESLNDYESLEDWEGEKKIEWTAKFTPALSVNYLTYQHFPDLMDNIAENRQFGMITSELPNNNLRAYLHSQRIMSIVLLPIFIKDKLNGFIGIDDCELERKWSKSDILFIENFVASVTRVIEVHSVLQKVKHSEHKFRSLVQEGLDLIAVIDADGNYSYISPSSVAVLGYDPEKLYSQNVFNYIHPEDVSRIRRCLAKALTERIVTIPPYRFKDAHGEWHWLITKLSNLLNDPIVNGIVTTSHDITKDIYQADELQLANERYRLIAKASKDHIYDWNLELGMTQRWGESLHTLFGYEDDEVQDSDFWKDKVHPEDQERIYTTLNRALENDSVDQCSEQYRFRKADGSYAIVSDSGHIVRDSKGKATRLIGSVRDISSLVIEKEEEQLMLSLSNSIGQPGSLEIRLYASLSILLQRAHIDAAEAWITSIDNRQINMVSFALKNDSDISFYHGSQKHTSFSYGVGMPGYLWKEKETVIWKNIDKNKDFIRWQSAKNANFKTTLGVPIIYNDQFLGSFLLHSKSKSEDLIYLKDVLQHVGSQIGAVLKHKITEDVFNNFFHISSDLLSIIGFDGNLKKLNKSYSKILGYSEEELLNTPFERLVHPDDQSIFADFLEKNIEQHKTVHKELRIIGKDNKVQWFHCTSQFKKEERVIFMVAKDITDQKKVEINLRQANDRLQTAQNIAKLGYWSRKLTDDVAEWSDETYAIFGYQPHEFVPNMENIKKTFHPDDRHMLDGLPSTEHFFTNRIITKNNELKWVKQHFDLKKDDHGVPYLIEGTVQDITEQMEHEKQLEISNERFELAMQASNEIIWDWDHKTNVITRSANYENQFGYKSKELNHLENSWFSLILEGETEDVWSSISTALENPQATFWTKEYKILTATNETAYVVDRCHILRDENGKPVRTVGAVLDITASKKQLSEIRKQNNALKSIAWMQSHRTRAPLARILGIMNLIEMETEVPPNIKNLLDHMLTSANDLDEVIKKILKQTDI
ncbi:PAS domain-containing protein [Fulvivirga ligni]|uniref:PAS domain-containing protein n=1 Tax=Fulvivirga ligni TaxID=2904246 RepID=UPI001F316053|nr:PAS domain-containing protein [Fulvivirga ligni]UII23994.1 PAS domain-containing protein [Fulvivirga ligni]